MSFCPNCGNQIASNTKFCTSCGTKVAADSGEYVSPQPVRQQPIQPLMPPQQQPYDVQAPASQKSKIIALLLALFLGEWGAHKFYLGDTTKGVIMLVIGFIGLFTFFPLLITGLWSLVDFIRICTMSEAELNSKYNSVG